MTEVAAGSSPGNTVTRAARGYIALVIAVIASFGLPLYLYPRGAPEYWAWTVSEPRTAMLVGSVYFVSTIYYVILFRQREWIRIEMSLRSLFIVAAWLLAAAMVHWNSFYPYRLQTLSWLSAYYLPLFFLPILFRLQRDRFQPDDPGEPISQAWREWLMFRGLVYLAGALILFAVPVYGTTGWPWSIEPVNVRMFSGQLAVFGAFPGLGMKEGSWRRLRLFMVITAMMGVAHVVLLTVPVGEYGWRAPGAVPVMLIPIEWLVTSLGLLLTYRGRR